jgi:hypothetical protein
MAAHPVTLRLPETLFDLFQSRAERAHRSLEAELLDAVATAAADEEELDHGMAKAWTNTQPSLALSQATA